MPELSNMQLFAIDLLNLFEAIMTYEISVFKPWMKELWNMGLEMPLQNELRALNLYLKSLSKEQ